MGYYDPSYDHAVTALRQERPEEQFVMLRPGDPNLPGEGDTATRNHINPGRVARQRTCTVWEIHGEVAKVRWDDGYDEDVLLATLVRV